MRQRRSIFITLTITLTLLFLGVPVIALAQPGTIDGQNLTSLALNPTSIFGGRSSYGQVHLNGPAPAGGQVIILLSSNEGVAHVTNITVPVGATTASFKVATFPVTQSFAVTITAQSRANNVVGQKEKLFVTTKTAQLTVVPLSFSVTLTPASIFGGLSSTGQVILDRAAPDGGFAVEFWSNFPNLVPNPFSITVPPGATKASFKVKTVPVTQSTTVTITASISVSANFAGVQRTAFLTVVPLSFSVTLSPASITGGQILTGQGLTGKVTLDRAAPSSFGVQLSSSHTAVTTLPAFVTIAAGATTASFPITTAAVAQPTAVTINAAAGGVSKTAQLTVLPPVPSAVTLKPTGIAGGKSVSGQVNLSLPAPAGGLVVNLSSSNTSVATVPAIVTVPAGMEWVLFTVQTGQVAQSTTATITATASGVSRTAQLMVTK